jgi:hypothetical protein
VESDEETTTTVEVIATAARAFVEAVDDLCDAARRPPSFDEIAGVLASIYASALNLPEVRWDEENDFDADALRGAVPVSGIFERLRDVFGVADAYPAVGYPEGEPELIRGSLADDLAGIYGDLTTGLRALESGVDPNNVVWEWRASYSSHWGAHLLDASRALHRLTTGT